jgi:hypothetical protein
MGSMQWSEPRSTKERLVLSDTPVTAITKLAEGNPGALRVCFEMLKNGPTIDPLGMDGIAALLNLDTLGIYGSRIWLLYKDVCRENLVITMACLRGWQLGIVNKNDLLKAIENADSGNRGNNLDLVAILAGVKKRLGKFGDLMPTPITPAAKELPERVIALDDPD